MTKEIDSAKEIVQIKIFCYSKMMCKDIYIKSFIILNVDNEIDAALKSLSANGKERLAYLEDHLSKPQFYIS